MKTKFLSLALIGITSVIYCQNPVNGILNHTNAYFTMNAFSSSYNDGSYAKIFYDGNNKTINFWNSDSGTDYTNLKIGNLFSLGKIGIGLSNPNETVDIVGVLGLRGINPSNLPSTYWRIYNNASSTVDSGLQFRKNNDIKVNFQNDKFIFDGLIKSKEVKVQLNVWSDFVFAEDYKLPTLNEVENHIKEKGHLKDIPSANEVAKDGIFLGEMDSKLLQKIEELTLYTIQQQKEIENLKNENESFKSLTTKFLELQKRLEKLEKNKS